MFLASVRIPLLSFSLLWAACASTPTSPGPLPGSPTPSSDPRLSALWQERGLETARVDYPIGAGDVLEIRVPDLPELEERTVRVGGDGNIELPLIGVVAVTGRTEQAVTEALRRRLAASVMYDPSVSVFVREYRSRIVGVIGAVATPGFHALASMDNTILDALTLAGGINDKAAPRLFFLPARPQGAGAEPVVPALAAADALENLGRGDPIVIELSPRTGTGSAVNLSLPVRPGDLIFVPERGEVLVKGWVQQPGSHPISPGLTVLGAVAASGGPRFAAKREQVLLIRSDREGRKLSQSFDLDQLERGEQLDVGLLAGDVIDVPASAPKAVVSTLYDFTQGIFSVGFGRSF
jgi:polysaccharide export outer membrane protein